MPRRRSHQLVRIAGIRVGVGASWFFVLFLFIFLVSRSFHDVLGGSETVAYLIAVASVFSFFGSVVLHEFGHAIVARRSGLEVVGIELWAFGGITQWTGELTSAGQELRVAAAGPLVTLAISLVTIAIGVATTSGHRFFNAATLQTGHISPVELWLSWLFSINVLVLAVNLLPGQPFDGGRILRALIWHFTGDQARATRATGRSGQTIALLAGGAGLYLMGAGFAVEGFYMLLLAFFLYQGASAAVVQGAFSKRIEGLRVADIMNRHPVTIPAETPVLQARESYFLRYGFPWFAVVDSSWRYLGVLRRDHVDHEISAGRPALTAGEVAAEDSAQASIDEQTPVEALLRAEPLRLLGAMVAVDSEGVLRGVVTLHDVQRAVLPTAGARQGF